MPSQPRPPLVGHFTRDRDGLGRDAGLVGALAVAGVNLDAPADYRAYLEEAVRCYENALYRAAILMVWSAVMQHLYSVASSHHGGVAAFEQANLAKFGGTGRYRKIVKADDFLYLGDDAFLQLGEDVGLYNRNARRLLGDRLTLRNLCGHPTKYQPGREETVIFIESLLLNVIGGAQLNW